jgi:hypothetical protein
MGGGLKRRESALRLGEHDRSVHISHIFRYAVLLSERSDNGDGTFRFLRSLFLVVYSKNMQMCC